ncbi:MAG: RNA polymerase sigma factor [Deltaproteobacteria bacterium]|nr:RNA polymerase sigma factor [Deltaproteobacteria bacterium]
MSAVLRPRPPTADDELALAAAGGDADAFAALYARYADRVYARITHLVGPGPDREDVLQQVFLELHRALPRFRGEATVSTFLYRIAIHVIYDHLRKRTRRPVDHDDAALDALIDGSPTPEERARRRQELAQIFAMLERIKPKKRIAFVLVAVEGLSLDEAAELVGTNAEAVKQRVLHARRELVALLDRAEKRTAPHDRRQP